MLVSINSIRNTFRTADLTTMRVLGTAVPEDIFSVRKAEALRLARLFEDHRRVEDAAVRRKLRSKGRVAVEELSPEMDNLVNARTRPHRCYKVPITAYFKNHQARRSFRLVGVSYLMYPKSQNLIISNAIRMSPVDVRGAKSLTPSAAAPAFSALRTVSLPFAHHLQSLESPSHVALGRYQQTTPSPSVNAIYAMLLSSFANSVCAKRLGPRP